MEIRDRETGAVWTSVSMWSLRKIRRARLRDGLSAAAATVEVLGQPDWTEPMTASADSW